MFFIATTCQPVGKDKRVVKKPLHGNEWRRFSHALFNFMSEGRFPSQIYYLMLQSLRFQQSCDIKAQAFCFIFISLKYNVDLIEFCLDTSRFQFCSFWDAMLFCYIEIPILPFYGRWSKPKCTTFAPPIENICLSVRHGRKKEFLNSPSHAFFCFIERRFCSQVHHSMLQSLLS